MLKIYFISSEINPFASVTTLATFSKEFSVILKENKDIDIRLTQPKYGYISNRRYILREVIRLKNLNINFNNKDEIINLKSGFIPNSRVQVYFMEHKEYFMNTGDLLYKSRNGRMYSNNNEKFSFFTKAALETLNKLYWIPDYIICNNWQSSILPILFHSQYKSKLKNTKIIFMIHEMNNLYNFDNDIYTKLNLKVDNKRKIQNNLVNGIKYSDYIYIFNDENDSANKYISKNKAVSRELKKKKYKIINYSPLFETSDRIEIYNNILKDLQKGHD